MAAELMQYKHGRRRIDALASAFPRVAMVQDGARRHYAVPVALRRAGMLDTAFTTWFASPGSIQRLISRSIGLVRPALSRRMLGRHHPELHRTCVRTLPGVLLAETLAQRRLSTAVERRRWGARQMTSALRRKGFGQANILHGFIRHLDPELCRLARERGLITVGDQIIAPAAVELAQARQEQDRWPGWEPDVWMNDLHATIEWEQETWAELDHIVCASDYVRQSLASTLGSAPDVTTIPNPLDAGRWRLRRRDRQGPKVTVGFVGRVGLRKGAPYFLEVARRLHGRAIRFVMVGGGQLSPSARDEFDGLVDLVGPVTRDRVQGWLDQFDMLLIPSTCEGSAGAVLEAMATGLPVICSHNTGSVVEDGVSGWVTAYDDVDAMAQRVEELAGDVSLRQTMGLAARRRIEAFDLDYYSRALGGLMRRLIASPSRQASP